MGSHFLPGPRQICTTLGRMISMAFGNVFTRTTLTRTLRYVREERSVDKRKPPARGDPTKATGSPTFTRVPDCSTMEPTVRSAPEPLFTNPGFAHPLLTIRSSGIAH